MIEKTLELLEFSYIRNKLESFAISELAKKKARTLKPLQDINIINHEASITNEAFNFLINSSNFYIGKIETISDYLNLARINSILQASELMKISDTLRTSRRLKKSIKAAQTDKFSTEILLEISDRINNLNSLEESINKAIISEDEIADNASMNLFRIRRKIESTREKIRSYLEKITQSKDSQKYLMESIVTIRQGRYVIPVKSEYKSKYNGIVLDRSKAGSTLFIEPKNVVELNNQISILEIDEKEEIKKILSELTAMVRENHAAIENNYIAASEIDFAFAKSKLALEQDAFKPKIVKRQYLKLKEARHPLLSKEECVPLNFEIGDGYKTVVITGPNTGGKTVAIKTMTLLSIMALSGLFIPAASGSVVGMFDIVLADIGDKQSISGSLSTFSSHMTNIVEMIKVASDKSFLVFDELGAGTDPSEGAALAISILKKVYSKNALCVATSHYAELKEYALITDGFCNASVEFDVEKLEPTYKLIIGIPGRSNAFEISKKLGLDENVIKDAKALLSSDNIEFEKILKEIDEKNKLLLAKIDKLNHKIKIVEDEKIAFQKSQEKLEKDRTRILKSAREEAEQLVAKARYSLNETVEKLKNIGINPHNRSDILAIKNSLSEFKSHRKKTISNHKNTDRKKASKLKIGKEYYIVSLSQKAKIVELDDKKKMAKIQAGIISSYVRFDEILDLKKSDIKISSKKSSIYEAKNKSYSSRVSVSKSAKSSVDLHGKDTLEAIHILDKFLDEAVVSGISILSVVHGIGTGVLKKAVIKHLREHPFVSDYRNGGQGEGGLGVTIVTLK